MTTGGKITLKMDDKNINQNKNKKKKISKFSMKIIGTQTSESAVDKFV